MCTAFGYFIFDQVENQVHNTFIIYRLNFAAGSFIQEHIPKKGWNKKRWTSGYGAKLQLKLLLQCFTGHAQNEGPLDCRRWLFWRGPWFWEFGCASLAAFEFGAQFAEEIYGRHDFLKRLILVLKGHVWERICHSSWPQPRRLHKVLFGPGSWQAPELDLGFLRGLKIALYIWPISCENHPWKSHQDGSLRFPTLKYGNPFDLEAWRRLHCQCFFLKSG